MNTKEKTHVATIILVIFGVLLLLSCLVLAGFSFFFIRASDNESTTSASPPIAVKARPFSLVKVHEVSKKSEGSYKVVLHHPISPERTVTSYKFRVFGPNDPKISVETAPRNPKVPLTGNVETILFVESEKALESIKVKFNIDIAGPGHKQSYSNSLLIDLEKQPAPVRVMPEPIKKR